MDPPPRLLPATLSDGVVRLDSHTLADAEAHMAGEDREMRLRFEAPDPDAIAGVAHVRSVLQSWIDARTAGGPNIVYAVRTLSNDLVGGCEIRQLTTTSAGVSYWIYPAFRRCGYAARALRLLSALACEIPGLRRLEAHIDADNLASRCVAVAAGFREEGVVEDAAQTGGTLTRALYVWRR
jgi:RimJ/RimL family protein N-acetyltransferase